MLWARDRVAVLEKQVPAEHTLPTLLLTKLLLDLLMQLVQEENQPGRIQFEVWNTLKATLTRVDLVLILLK